MELSGYPLYHFDRRRDAGDSLHTDSPPAPAAERQRALYCAHCRRHITEEAARISLRGAHQHTCTNPYGTTFHIGCFSGADGCNTLGPASLEHTWFPGYAWSIALCGNCDTHLGWRFTSSLDSFYGLVLRELVSASE